jgi:prevent-host-death family protein
MKLVTATQANRDFAKLLGRVEQGETIGITLRGKLVASLQPGEDIVQEREAILQKHLTQLRKRKPLNLPRVKREEMTGDA